MANKALFKSAIAGRATDTVNEAGGIAYSLPAKAALAQIAATGTLSDTYYTTADGQLGQVLKLAKAVDPTFVAKTAVYARNRGHMKDMPALLTAHLSTIKDSALFSAAFRNVINNGKMLRNFVQIMRSGTVGRKSLGTRPKKLVQEWLRSSSNTRLIEGSVGNDPSLADVIKMTHPKPVSTEQNAFFGYVIDKPHETLELPVQLIKLAAFRVDATQPVPYVPFQLLTSLDLTPVHWEAIARKANWHETRMNLNTFQRHGVLDNPELVEIIANRLRDPEAISRARVFPYQLLMAFKATTAVPHAIREALQDAMEAAVSNVPAFGCRVAVLPDVSGSMSSTPVTGHRKGATTQVACRDVAALMSACVLRKNPDARIIPFSDQAYGGFRLNPRDSIMTNAEKLAALPSGGTNCASPLAMLNGEGALVDLVIFVSDNESWIDSRRYSFSNNPTRTMVEWERLKARNPKARLVCIDLAPYTTTQAAERADIMNIGGFSDAIFETIGLFWESRLTADHWIGEIEKIEL